MKTNLSKVDKERQVFLMLSLRKNDSRLRWKKITLQKKSFSPAKKFLTALFQSLKILLSNTIKVKRNSVKLLKQSLEEPFRVSFILKTQQLRPFKKCQKNIILHGNFCTYMQSEISNFVRSSYRK